MQLVNIDDIKKFYNEEFPELDNSVHWSRNDIIMNLDSIPTVEAIPVKWIENWVKETYPITEEWKDYMVSFGELIEAWERRK